MTRFRLALLGGAALAAAAAAAVFQPSGAQGAAVEPESGRLTVLGTGAATATPDRASFAFGTVAQARTATAALSASGAAVERVVEALRRAGVDRVDIQTTDVSVAPRWDESEETIVGYTAVNTVTATVRRLDRAGALIDAAVAAGANQVSGPNLLASDESAAYRLALRAAIADARAKAQALAAASGVTTGPIVAIEEAGSGVAPIAAVDAERAAGAAVEPGTRRIDATVSVTFSLG